MRFIFTTLLLSLLFFAQPINAQKLKHNRSIKIERKINKLLRKVSAKKSKAVVAALDISMGFLGVHRLYLGTSTKVPIVYAITLGGGGFLVLTDLIITLSAKDLEKYSNNDQILLWNVNEE